MWLGVPSGRTAHPKTRITSKCSPALARVATVVIRDAVLCFTAALIARMLAPKKMQMPRNSAHHGMNFRHAKERKRDKILLPTALRNWIAFFNGIGSFFEIRQKTARFHYSRNRAVCQLF
jgi:hypothetical protein